MPSTSFSIGAIIYAFNIANSGAISAISYTINKSANNCAINCTINSEGEFS